MDSFKSYALATGVHEQIISFVAFRPQLLHKIDATQPAWPSPRSWVMASALHHAGLDIAPAVGAGTATEFNAFRQLYAHLPDFNLILDGKGDGITFPEEPSVRYALTVGLTARAQETDQAYHAFKWLTQTAAPEWVQLCAVDLFKLMRQKGKWRTFSKRIGQDAQLQEWMANYQSLIAGAGDEAAALGMLVSEVR